MKKILGVILCFVLACSVFTGCKGNNETGDNTTTTAEETTTGVDDSKYDLSNLLKSDYSKYIDIGQYKGIEIKTSSEDYQNLRKQYIEYYLTQKGFVTEYEDRAIEDGDTVNIDYVGYMDGVPFENGSTEGNGAELTIGSNQYIDDFEQQLIGHKPGENVTVTVNFPDPYEKNPDFAGKEAVFEVVINKISSAPIYPDLSKNPDILKECFGYDSMEEFEKGIQKEIAENLVMNIALENINVISYPEDELLSTKKEITDYYEMIASNYSMTLDDYLEAIGVSDIDEIAEYQVKLKMYFLEILRKENIEYTDEEYREMCEDYAKECGYSSLDELLSAVSSNYDSDAQAIYELSEYLLQQKAQSIIVDNLVVVDD